MTHTHDTIDTGDTVLHAPTGEQWIVACVNGDRLSWVGWPEGSAPLTECTLVAKATKEKRDEMLRLLAAMTGDDHRKRYAQQRLSAPNVKADARESASVASSALLGAVNQSRTEKEKP
jgi:hypothetical protein